MPKQCQCPNCQPKCLAEHLIALAELTLEPSSMLVDCTGASERENLGMEISRIALAIDFYKRPAAFKFRAIFEEWDHLRLFREMY